MGHADVGWKKWHKELGKTVVLAALDPISTSAALTRL